MNQFHPGKTAPGLTDKQNPKPFSPTGIGREFEIYIENLFSKKEGRFIPVKHDSNSALVYGMPAAKATYPDLKFIFQTRYGRTSKFAVECKWRISFVNGLITWASEIQVRNYTDFQKNFRIPVFVAIGIGGLPSDPDRLFVTPLDIIKHHHTVAEQDLLLYNRRKNQRFFYDTKQLKLF